MVKRPTIDDHFTGIHGYKFEYGYNALKTGNPDVSPRTHNARQVGGSPTMQQDIAEGVMSDVAETFVNLDTFANPQDGKVVMKDELFTLVQWANLDHTKRVFDLITRNLKPIFKGVILPYDVDTLYVVYYLKMNTVTYPSLKGCKVAFKIPVKGPGKNWMSLFFPGGKG